jgi:ribosomal protein S28E/S33
MAFISAMLRGFVNRQNPIQGPMSIGGGALILHNPTVTGANTTATIASSTSLTAETTDTVVRINTGNDQTRSAFVINVKGPARLADGDDRPRTVAIDQSCRTAGRPARSVILSEAKDLVDIPRRSLA